MSKIFFRALYVLTILVVVTNTLFALGNSIFPDINDLPDGELKASYISPDGNSRIDIYAVDCNLGTGVKGVYVTEDGSKNVFWQTGQTYAAVKWVGDGKAEIDNVLLDVRTEVFDSRFSTAIFSEGLLRRSRRK